MIKMNRKIFTNRHVTKILDITERQVIDWRTRGIVKPRVDARGAGSKALFDYVNLLELELIRNLLQIGLQIHRVKEILDFLRLIREQRAIKERKRELEQETIPALESGKKEENLQIAREELDALKQERCGVSEDFIVEMEHKNPIGIMVIFFKENGGLLKISLLKNSNEWKGIKDNLEHSKAGIIIDLLKIKRRVDSSIESF